MSLDKASAKVNISYFKLQMFQYLAHISRTFIQLVLLIYLVFTYLYICLAFYLFNNFFLFI